MALISPGVEVQIYDESQYTPTAAGTVAYVLLATEQNKQTPTGTIASYTTKATAGKLQKIVSQRDLVQKYGSIAFKVDASDNPIHGDERNEYGLLAAYSALGVSNQIYVQRADVDLAQLEGTGIRPTGQAVDGTYWLDISTNTNWGIYEWTEDGKTFAAVNPLVINNDAELDSGYPLQSIGKIGQYAVVTTSIYVGVFYKKYDNTWVKLGTQDWVTAVPTVVGTLTGTLNDAQSMIINGEEITLTLPATVANAADRIIGITGVTARVNASNQLELFADETAASNGAVADGKIKVEIGTGGGGDCAVALGLIPSGGTEKTYNPPIVDYKSYNQAPAWRATDAPNTRPYGSVWIKTSSKGNGIDWAIKEYDANKDSWVKIAAPVYANDNAAIYGLDPAGGGVGIATGSLYIQYESNPTDPTSTVFTLFKKVVPGNLKIVGTVAGGSAVYTIGDKFDVSVSQLNGTTSDAEITLTGTTAAELVADILNADIPYLSAAIESSGAISLTHTSGGTIRLTTVSGGGSPLLSTGLLMDNHVRVIEEDVTYLATPWADLTYVAKSSEPYNDPADGTLWYYNTATEVDMLINDGSGWVGYQVPSSDSRGYNLQATDPTGPILAALKPTKQSNGIDDLVPGDLWIDTSSDGSLEVYPKIYRYNDQSVWELIDNTDQITTDGIVFADARWSALGLSDPVSDDIPAISDLLTSTYTDPDAPDYRLYARGTLLFNTRRSGYNVKRFESTWFADAGLGTSYPIGTWVSSSGNDENGVPYFGHKAQRNVVVEALKAAITSSTELREEQVQFNLIVCPGYPELIQNMVALNNDRKQTAFIIGDSPLALNSSDVEAWAKNTNLAVDNGENGLVTTSEYVGIYYPSGYGTDLAGESVVVPPSHMMLRTFIRSDGQSYPWFAPAGVRRGVIDNVSSIGYIDTADGNLFKSIGVTLGLRDVLYENRVNPLTVLPGVGLVAYGQKTRLAYTSALDRVNVVRLICYLRLVLDKVARPFIFEPNDTITRNQVKAGFEAVLNDVVAKRGLYDYLVVCDTTNNTPDRIDRNELYVDIAIKPVKAIEFIYIPVRVRNTGAVL